MLCKLRFLKSELIVKMSDKIDYVIFFLLGLLCFVLLNHIQQFLDVILGQVFFLHKVGEH